MCAVIKKFLISEEKLVIFNKLFKKKTIKKKIEGHFKNLHKDLEEFKITLSEELETNEHHFIKDLKSQAARDWHKWFMTNNIAEIIILDKDYKEAVQTYSKTV